MSYDTLADNTISYFQVVEGNLHIINERFAISPSARNDFEAWISETFGLLYEALTRPVILETVQLSIELDRTVGKRDAYDLLNMELQFYVNNLDLRQYNANQIDETITNNSAASSMEIGEVGVNSIKDIFNKLPKWIQKVLTVISEMLGIAKVIAAIPLA